MNNDEKKVSDALDDIFGSDFLEIDAVEEKKVDNETYLNEDDQAKKETFFNANLENKNLFDKENLTVINSASDTDIKPMSTEDIVKSMESSNTKDFNSSNIYDKPLEDKLEDTQPIIIDKNIDNKNNEEKKQDINYKKIIIYLSIGIVIGIIFFIIFMNIFVNKEKSTYCYYKAENNDFKLTDEYTIIFKQNKLIYIKGNYNYLAKTEEFKSQLEFIRKEKIPIIVNSNGMPGFTHIYEQSDSEIKILSYYDMSLIDYKVVDKNDDKAKPLSYINLKSNVTYKKLVDKLEKDGYKCTPSK